MKPEDETKKRVGKVFDMRNLSEMSRRTGYPTETLRRWKNKPLSIKAVDLDPIGAKNGGEMTHTYIDTGIVHRKVRTWSYIVILTEKGGSNVKHVVLHGQTSMDEARRTALEDNTGYRLKAVIPLTERDFEP